MRECDFHGWATKNDLRCSDGRIIRRDAFKDNDGQTVPLVWNHQHDGPDNVLGHAVLENRNEGVYTYCWFNESENGSKAKLLVEHGDISALSIYANQLKQDGPNVLHGDIREVSLVYAGANPGASIQSVIRHSADGGEDYLDECEGVIFTGEQFSLYHAEKEEENKLDNENKEIHDEMVHADEGDKTIGDVLDTLNEEQKKAVEALIGIIASESDENENNDEEDTKMKHSVFENEENKETVLSHADMDNLFKRGKQLGSLKEAVDELCHSAEYGIDQIDMLFPEAKNLNNPPEFISREMGWVQKVMSGVHHTPFSRIKSMFANITEDEARAKGYIKGKLKKEEVFSLLKRTTTPTTIYKKQKLDRDDVIDITDFDVVAWLKAEMRMMLDEEIARAILIGDGRLTSDDDHISQDHIRPVYNDNDLFTIKTTINVAADATDDQKAKAIIRAAIKSRKNYKGSGEPVMFTTEDVLTDMLLLEDNMGHILYDSKAKLANMLRVKDIVTVPVMEGLEGPNGGDIVGIIVNLADYNVGADKGGAVNMFDDFDIDYNQQKYLIETRCSGALIKPYSAIAMELVVAQA